MMSLVGRLLFFVCVCVSGNISSWHFGSGLVAYTNDQLRS